MIGPDGEIILPTVWERVVQPDWSITMHMWPMERMPQRPMPPMGGPGGIPGRPPPHGHRDGHRIHMPGGGGMFPPGARPIGHRVGGGPGGPPVPPPPPGAFQGFPGRGRPPMPPGGPEIIEVGPGKAPKRVSKAGGTTVLAWMTGSKPKSSGKKYVSHAHGPSKPRSYYTAQFVTLAPYKSVPALHSPLSLICLEQHANMQL